MSKYDSLLDLAAKIDSEGGLDSFLEYGFELDELPADVDGLLYGMTEDMLDAWDRFHHLGYAWMNLLPVPGPDDPA